MFLWAILSIESTKVLYQVEKWVGHRASLLGFFCRKDKVTLWNSFHTFTRMTFQT